MFSPEMRKPGALCPAETFVYAALGLGPSCSLYSPDAQARAAVFLGGPSNPSLFGNHGWFAYD